MNEKSYPTRGRAEPLKHRIYTHYLSQLGLSAEAHMSLSARKIPPAMIQKAGYANKGTNKARATESALASTRGEFKEQLEGIPGFFIHEKTGHWTHLGITGIMIPVCDVEGNMGSVVVRNENPTLRNGKPVNKYVQFSSGGKVKGAKAWQTSHCPRLKGLPKEVCGSAARITEGVLKADVATALGDVYCVGMRGLNVNDDLEPIFDELEIDTLIISLDQGEDDNPDILRAYCKLIKLGNDLGFTVQVEKWDPKLGKGIDDVLASGSADKIEQLSEEEINELLEKGNAADPCNGQWVYCIEVERFVNKDDFREYKKSQFTDKFGLVDVKNASMLINRGIPDVEKLTFAPGEEQIVEEDGMSCFNMWRDPRIIAKEGDASIFLDHINYIMSGDENQIGIFLDWLAFQIQNPGVKILWAPVLIGKEGVGKSFLGEAACRMLGHHNVSFPSNDDIHEKYTTWIKNAILVVIEEIMAQDRRGFMNKMKPFITQPKVPVRDMHKASYVQPNRANFIMFSNHDDSLPVTDGDRRYCFLDCDVEMKSDKYYNDIWEWLKSVGSTEALVYYFKNRDVSNYNPNAKAPKTSKKDQIIEISLSALQEWVITGIRDEVWPYGNDITSIRHLKEVAPRGLDRLSDFKYSQALKAAGAKQLRVMKMSDGSQARLWTLRRHEIIAGQDNDWIKKNYESHKMAEAPGNPLAEIKPL